MTDILEAAEAYRQKLRAELARLDQFLSYAESLPDDADPERRLMPAGRSGDE